MFSILCGRRTNVPTCCVVEQPLVAYCTIHHHENSMRILIRNAVITIIWLLITEKVLFLGSGNLKVHSH
jgi:hypothetical protein